MFRWLWPVFRQKFIFLSIPVVAAILILKFAIILLPLLAGAGMLYLIYFRFPHFKYRKHTLITILLLTLLTSFSWAKMIIGLDQMNQEQSKLATTISTPLSQRPTPTPEPVTVTPVTENATIVTPIEDSKEDGEPHSRKSSKSRRG